MRNNNRFEKCKTLEHLYNVFSTEDGIQDFENLSKEELDRIVLVFEANMPKGTVLPVTPLNKAGYTYIWNVVVEEIETMPVETEDEMEEENMENNTTINNVTIDNATEEMFKKIMEESAMENKKESKVKVTVNNAIHNMTKAAKSVKIHAGEDKESLINRCDGSINNIKDAMEPVLEVLDDALGCTALKEEICEIMYDTLNGVKSQKGFFRMAQKCRAAIDRKIRLLSIVDPDDKLGKIAALRTFLGEDEYGDKIVETQTIWTVLAKSLVWVCKKVSRKLKSWFGTESESNIFGAVGASIAQAFAKVGNVIKNAAKIAGTVLSYVTSYVVAGVIKLTSFIITAIKFVVEKIKGWCETAKQKFSKEDEDTDAIDDIAVYEDIIEAEMV